MNKLSEDLKRWLKKALKWLKTHLSDRTFRIIFYLVCIILYSEVWVCMLVGFIIGVGTTIGKVLIGFATTCAGIWASPLLPFFPVSLAVTTAIYEFIKRK